MNSWIETAIDKCPNGIPSPATENLSLLSARLI